MNPSDANSNLLVTEAGILIFLGAADFEVTGVKMFGEEIYFTLKKK